MKKNFLTYFLFFVIFSNINSYADDNFIDYNETEENQKSFIISEKYSCEEIYDPYEGINRKILILNAITDAILLKPVAVVYDRKAPPYVKSMVANFNKNLTMPFTSLNSILQVDIRNFVSSIWSFFFNSTVGIGGLVDVSKKIGINPQGRTFGSTLARYGAGPGAYVVLPIFGSTNTRDMWDFFRIKEKMDVLSYYTTPTIETFVLVSGIVEKRAESLKYENQIRESADPYALLRSMYHQHRESELHYPSRYICRLNKKYK